MNIDTRTAVPSLPIETVTPIRPSEAIRLGCLTSGPAKGAWITDDGSTCALGAMQIGFGGEAGCGNLWTDAYREFRDRKLPYPHGGEAPSGAVIMYLNDGGWSRERIADWLEGLGL